MNIAINSSSSKQRTTENGIEFVTNENPKTEIENQPQKALDGCFGLQRDIIFWAAFALPLFLVRFRIYSRSFAFNQSLFVDFCSLFSLPIFLLDLSITKSMDVSATEFRIKSLISRMSQSFVSLSFFA